MVRLVFSIVLALVIFLANINFVKASLLVVETDGTLQTNVLSAESDFLLENSGGNDLEIDKVALGKANDASIIKLDQSDGKVNLSVYGNSGVNNLNVTDYKENILEIKQRPEVQKMEISLSGNQFRLKNKGTVAVTSFPITIDSKTADMSIDTGIGDQNLTVFPHDAVLSALRTKLISRVVGDIEIVVEGDRLAYKISGDKIFNLFNLYDYPVSISSYISAETGEVVRVDAPDWLKFINFLFA